MLNVMVYIYEDDEMAVIYECCFVSCDSLLIDFIDRIDIKTFKNSSGVMVKSWPSGQGNGLEIHWVFPHRFESCQCRFY